MTATGGRAASCREHPRDEPPAQAVTVSGAPASIFYRREPAAHQRRRTPNRLVERRAIERHPFGDGRALEQGGGAHRIGASTVLGDEQSLRVTREPYDEHHCALGRGDPGVAPRADGPCVPAARERLEAVAPIEPRPAPPPPPPPPRPPPGAPRRGPAAPRPPGRRGGGRGGERHRAAGAG